MLDSAEKSEGLREKSEGLDPLERIIWAAEAAFQRYGLLGWRFEFDSALNRYGFCRHSERLISMSRALVVMNTLDQSLDILLHEVAHALVGPGYGHGPVWKEVASKIGARPVRCYDTCNPSVKRVGRFIASCKCGTPHLRQRKPRGLKLCARCRQPLHWSPVL